MDRKEPRYTQIRLDVIMGISVLLFTKTILKNVFRGSRTPLGTHKFARKLSPGHEDITVHRTSPQKRNQWVENPPGTVKFALQTTICDEIVSSASSCHYTPKLSSKTDSAGQQPQVHFNSRRNYLLSISVSPYTKIVLKNGLSGSTTPGTLKFASKLSPGH